MTDNSKNNNKNYPLVAIGAAAGGMEAISALLEHLPGNSGLVYLYIQADAGLPVSALVERLSATSVRPVLEATHRLQVAPDHVYVVPADKLVSLHDYTFRVAAAKQQSALQMPISYFFSELAEQYKEKVIGIVLSGDTADGLQGMRAIKIAGGLTFAQDESAGYQRMPKGAIAEGIIDLVLSTREMAEELKKIAQQKEVYYSAIQELNEEAINNLDKDLLSIISMLMKSTGVDFSQYKMTTIKRRIIRRMMLHKLETLKAYEQYLQQNKNEVHLLYQDLLINVTTFFRDTEMCEHLKKVLLPQIINPGRPMSRYASGYRPVLRGRKPIPWPYCWWKRWATGLRTRLYRSSPQTSANRPLTRPASAFFRKTTCKPFPHAACSAFL